MTSRATLGEIRIADREVCTNQGFKSLVPDASTDGEFLFYQLLQNKERYRSLGIGSTFLEVNKRATERFELLVATREEQCRIAEILTTVDDAIAHTEALIAKTQQIKAGLMHDLFTRGVTPDGQLRPSRDEAPKLYKESPVGWIPREWEVAAIDDLCSQVVDCPHSTPVYLNSGIPCIRTADMVPGELLLDDVFRVTEKTYIDRVERLVPRKGDVIYSREGERLGIASPVGDERVCLGQRVMLLRPNSETSESYLSWAMNAPDFYRRVVSGLGATTSPHVNVGDICRTKILRPPLHEQESIGQTIDAQHLKTREERTHRAHLSCLKSGLMHDLLTGRVRVPVTPP